MNINDNIKELMYNKVRLMKILNLVDNETSIDEHVNTLLKIHYEQEDKNIITDKNIDYNDEIISIEDIGDCETIDISVTGDSLFYCNNILTKNSIGLAATADVIVSIFQNEEDRELNVIRIGMMKNRFGPRGDTQAMSIDYTTLTIEESDEPTSSTDESTLNTLNELLR